MSIRSFLISATVLTLAASALGQAAEKKADGAPKSIERTFAFTINPDDGGYLGVETENVNKENSAKFGLSSVRGVAVKSVVDDSPAAKAGIIAGDVIVSVGGEEVTSVRKLSRLVSEIAPDHEVKIGVLRSGSEMNLTATIGKRPGPAFQNGNFRMAAPMTLPGEMPDMKILKELETLKVPGNMEERVFTFPEGKREVLRWNMRSDREIGVGIMPLTKQLADSYNVGGGLLVTNVAEVSPAAKAGIKAGDILTEANGKQIKEGADLIRELNATKGDLSITFERKGARKTVTVTPEKAKDSGINFDREVLQPMPAPRMPAMPRVMLNGSSFPGRVI
ncbi:MAG TPA: PDZ domain-containing protein [Pyrinomonadaceae bacterium]|nr:PDZ domain-containing protein [Pyrinomonadaceae bacterium]